MSTIYLTDIELLCAECHQPIKARINTQQWIRVEWIGPEGECLKCHQVKRDVSVPLTGVETKTEIGTVKATRNYNTPAWNEANDND